MTGEIELAGAIAGLVAEKHALGYKYVSEERALARFERSAPASFPVWRRSRERRWRRGSPRRGGGR